MHDKNVRMRLLEVHKILMNTRESDAINVKKIIERLNRSIQLSKPFTDRKAIYKDVEAIIEAGFPVNIKRGMNNELQYFM